MRRTLSSLLKLIFILVFRIAVAQPEVIDSLKSRLPLTSGEERIHTLIHLSEANRGYSFNDCIVFGTQAVDLAKNHNNLKLQGLALKSIGVSYLFEGDLELSLQYFNNSLDRYTDNNHLAGMANCLNNIGLVYLYRGNYTLATESFQQNYAIVSALDNKADIANASIKLGNVNYYRSNFQQSLSYYYQAMLIYSDLEDESGMADAYYSLGIVYSELKNYKKALEFYGKAENTYRRTGNKRDLSHVLNNMAKIYNFEYKDYKTAHSLYQQTLDLKKQLSDKIGIALLYNNLGTLFGNKKDYITAMVYFSKSKVLYEEIESESGLTMVVYNIGEVFYEKGDLQQAISSYKQSLEMAKKIGEVSYINKNYEALFLSYAKLCDYDRFYKFYNLFAIGKDTLIDRLHEAEIAVVEAKYSVEELLRESAKIQTDNERKAEELRKYRLLIAGVTGLFVLLLLMYFVFKWRKSKKHLFVKPSVD